MTFLRQAYKQFHSHYSLNHEYQRRSQGICGQGLDQDLLKHFIVVLDHLKKTAKDFNINTRAAGKPVATNTSQTIAISLNTAHPREVLRAHACETTRVLDGLGELVVVHVQSRVHKDRSMAFVVDIDRELVELKDSCAGKNADEASRHGWRKGDAVIMELRTRTDRLARAVFVLEGADPTPVVSFCEVGACLVDGG